MTETLSLAGSASGPSNGPEHASVTTLPNPLESAVLETGVGDEAARVRLAANPHAPTRLLRALSQDPNVKVRAALAMNPAAPADADSEMARDTDERVRILLGRKLSTLMPALPDHQRERMQHQAHAALRLLVSDEALRVRAAIADVLKDMPGAPRDLVLTLAQDMAMEVAEPVIRLSPLLGVEDLLHLLAISPCPETATAVARRPHLSEAVADAIAATSNPEAIAALLTNTTAAIREATLDTLIVRAADEVSWHEPLVRRPVLSTRAARALSDIVTTHLLGVLAARTDLDRGLAHDLHQRLASRLEPVPQVSARTPTIDEAMELALAMARRETLVEATILAAAQRGEARMCTALLAVAAGVSVAVVERASALRSAKGLVSLVWKAGFSMQVAQPLQTLLVRLPPEAILRPMARGGFPLVEDEMRWQIEFLTRTGR